MKIVAFLLDGEQTFRQFPPLRSLLHRAGHDNCHPAMGARHPSGQGPGCGAGERDPDQGQGAAAAGRQRRGQSAARPAAGITVKSVFVPPDKDEATLILSATREAKVGLKQNIIISAVMMMGKETIVRYAPAIPIRIVEHKAAVTSSSPQTSR